jgi:hypothetical protein
VTPRPSWTGDLSRIVKVILPVIYGGASLRLLALLRSGRDPAVRELGVDPAVRELGVALAAVAGGGSLIAPSVLDGIADLTGDANYGRFFSQVCTVVAAGQGQATLLRSAYPPNRAEAAVRARRLRMLGTLALMGALFSRDRAAAAELQIPTDRLYEPLPAAYWLSFTSSTMLTAGEVGRLALRASRTTEKDSVRVGMRTTAAGALLLAAFYAQYAAAITGRLVSPRFPGPVRGVPAQTIIGSAAALIALGASLPGAARRARAAPQHRRDARDSIALQPLWRELRRVRPQTERPVGTALSPPAVRLAGQVIAILDGLLRLTAEYDPEGRIFAAAEEVGRQRGLDAADVTALQRAALIRYAARCASGVKSDGEERWQDRDISSAGTAARQDFRKEARRLLRVKTFLRSSFSELAETGGEADEIARSYHAHAVTQPWTPANNDREHCACLPTDSDSVGYLEYAVGRAEAEKALAEARSGCRVHGGATQPARDYHGFADRPKA